MKKNPAKELGIWECFAVMTQEMEKMVKNQRRIVIALMIQSVLVLGLAVSVVITQRALLALKNPAASQAR